MYLRFALSAQPCLTSFSDMSKKFSLKQKDSFETRLKHNKKIAIRLLVSLVVFMAIYFGFLRVGFYHIQDIYIFTSFALAIAYAVCAIYTAKIRQHKLEKDLTKKEKELLSKLASAMKHLIIIFLPMFIAVVSDALILFYDSFGISDYLGI